MIYITGDMHGSIDKSKLNTKKFPEQKRMTKKDYVIITGDFGCIWDNSKEQEWFLKWLDSKNFTTLFLDGNHENMPFCDAMMIDNECRNYVDEPSTRELIPCDTILFSTSKRDELINYLEQIEGSASNEHLKLVETVYGANWGEPFYNLFDY